MKKPVFFTFIFLAFVFQTQSRPNSPGIVNNSAHIVSSGSGSYWVVSGGNFTFTSRSATELTSMNNLVVASGASFSIDSQSYLSITGSVTNSNSAGTVGITINSDVNGTASLITPSATGSGSAVAWRWMSAGTWHLISAPVSGQTVANFLTANNTIATNASNRGMMDYNPTNNVWNPFFTNVSAGTLGSGKGFCARMGAGDGSVSANGLLQAGIISVPVAGGLWDCIGNPYTSAIGITSSTAASANFLTANTANFDPSYGALYVWATGSDTYNGQWGNYTVVSNVPTTGFNDLPQGQAFMVKRKAFGGADFSFNTAMQLHNGVMALKSSQTPWPMIRLVATSNSQTSSTIIAFNDGMTRGLDPTYDAGLLKGASELSVYTRLVEDNGIQFAIQALPDNNFTSIIVPIGIDSQAGGDVVFSAETTSLPNDCKVILEDKFLKTFTDLSANVYEAAIMPNSTIADRFRLHTSIASIGSVGQGILSGKLIAFAIQNEGIHVVGEVSGTAVATLYDALGKVVLIRKLEEGTLNLIPTSSVASGLYILSIKDNGKAEGFKMRIMN